MLPLSLSLGGTLKDHHTALSRAGAARKWLTCCTSRPLNKLPDPAELGSRRDLPDAAHGRTPAPIAGSGTAIAAVEAQLLGFSEASRKPISHLTWLQKAFSKLCAA